MSDFVPVHPGKVGMYVCGMTVQDRPHMGHMRAAIVGDLLRRYLQRIGFRVTFLNNFTDIDDKIIDRANKEGIDYRVVVERNIEAYHRIAREVNILPATHYPYATHHIPEIIAMVGSLIAKGNAYAVDGDVYFRVRTKSYGKLSRARYRRFDFRLARGSRREKEDPLDFALWKASKPGEPYWDSPWGKGRPGWHIECSAMAVKILGETIDFHGGGEGYHCSEPQERVGAERMRDRQGVRSVVDAPNGLLNLRGTKMSKSTGHFFGWRTC